MDHVRCQSDRVTPAELQAILEAHGVRAVAAATGDAARQLLDRDDVDVVIIDQSADVAHCELLAAAIEAANVGLWDWDLREHRVEFSREWKRQLGYEDHEISDAYAEWSSRVHVDDYDRACAEVLAYLANPTPTLEQELRLRHKDGSYRWILSRASLRYGPDGRPVRMLGAHLDVTERKQAQLRLAERDSQLALCIEHTPVPIAMFDNEMRYLAASRSWSATFRLGAEPLLGRSYYEVFPDLPEHWKHIHRRGLAGHTERCDEEPFVRSDGTVEWVRWEVRPWRRPDGGVGGIVVFFEIVTERRQIAKALRDSEAHLRTVADTVPHLVYELGPHRELRYANRAWREYFGRDHLEPSQWTEVIHPDDLPTVDEGFGRVIALGSDYPIPPVRLRRADGIYRWFAVQAAPVYDDDGELAYLVGASTDIHELKSTQDALDESQHRLVTALRVGRIGTWRWDVDADR